MLEDENLKLKIRLEDAEDEIDRVINSRDREARVLATEEEVQRIREEAGQEVHRAHEQTESYRHEYEMLEKANSRLQQENMELKMKADGYSAQLQDREVAEVDYRTRLQSALSHLEPEPNIPSELNGVVETVEAAARKHKANLDELRHLLEEVHEGTTHLESRMREREVEIEDLRDRLGNEEMEVFSTRESLAEHREELKRLTEALNKERIDHNQLKNKHQDTEDRAESASRELDVLRVALEESKDTSRNFESKLQDVHGMLSARLAKRARRAEVVSQRLFTQAISLEKLLQQIGYTVTRQQGGPMAVQKVPKAPGTSIVLSSSGPLPNKSAPESSPYPEYVSWAASEDPETEGRLYDLLDADVASFDIDVFHEAIIKRIKDAEHLARKWQREARGYRDRFHRAQNEAQEKIAFRSFKEGDLALFLPTRNQATRPWAAFNVGAPHYFLREQDSHSFAPGIGFWHGYPRLRSGSWTCQNRSTGSMVRATAGQLVRLAMVLRWMTKTRSSYLMA